MTTACGAPSGHRSLSAVRGGTGSKRGRQHGAPPPRDPPRRGPKPTSGPPCAPRAGPSRPGARACWRSLRQAFRAGPARRRHEGRGRPRESGGRWRSHRSLENGSRRAPGRQREDGSRRSPGRLRTRGQPGGIRTPRKRLSQRDARPGPDNAFACRANRRRTVTSRRTARLHRSYQAFRLARGSHFAQHDSALDDSRLDHAGRSANRDT